eukprot:4513805-Pyramimonas_sp.AAC.1
MPARICAPPSLLWSPAVASPQSRQGQRAPPPGCAAMDLGRHASSPRGGEINARRLEKNAAWRRPNLRDASDVAHGSAMKLLQVVTPADAPIRACARM